MRNEFWADEYSSWPLLQDIEKALDFHTPGDVIVWEEWEEEAEVRIKYQKFNSLAEDGFFILDIRVSAYAFKDGYSNTMNQPTGVEFGFVEREVLRKFYTDLNNEMLVIYNGLPEDHKQQEGEGGGIGSRPRSS